MKFYSRSPALFLAFFALACASCAAWKPAEDRLGQLSKNAVHLKVPFERQAAPKLCGLASADMLTAYYGQALSALQREGLLEEAAAQDGVSGDSLKATLQAAGYFVAVFPGTLDRQSSGLYHHLDLGRPCIVMTGVGLRHYSVLNGYDEDRALVFLMDPAVGEITVPIQDFMREWKEANHFTLLAVPDKEMPAK